MNYVEKDIIHSYDRMAKERDKLEISDWKKQERNEFTNLLKESKTNNILEIGAGTGKDSLYFQQLGLNVISTDLSPEMVRICQEKGLHAKVMNVFDLDFPDDSFDAVWALNCLLHIPKQELPSALKEIKRVLKPDGLFYMGVYGGKDSEGVWEKDTYEPKRFFSLYPDNKIKEVVGSVFDVVYFHVVPRKTIGGELSFQSMILKK